MIVPDALRSLIESPSDDIMEEMQARFSHLSGLVSDISIDTAAADWDVEESDSLYSMHEKLLLRRRRKRILMNSDDVDLLSV